MPEANVRQALYLIADQMRGMAALARHFADNVYHVERAHRLMELAAELAVLADESAPDPDPDDARSVFLTEPWLHTSPAIGVDALVLDPGGRVLLVSPKGNVGWAMPGGLMEIGETPAEAVLRELWEEAGLRGRVSRLLGLFDARLWGTRSKAHLVQLVFLVHCDQLASAPGLEIHDARFFAPDRLPEPLRAGHHTIVPRVLELAHSDVTFFDPAESYGIDMPMHQRPASP